MMMEVSQLRELTVLQDVINNASVFCLPVRSFAQCLHLLSRFQAAASPGTSGIYGGRTASVAITNIRMPMQVEQLLWVK